MCLVHSGLSARPIEPMSTTLAAMNPASLMAHAVQPQGHQRCPPGLQTQPTAVWARGAWVEQGTSGENQQSVWMV